MTVAAAASRDSVSPTVASAALVAGPGLLVFGIAVFFAGDAIRAAGLDLAKSQGFVGVPAVCLAPAILVLGYGSERYRATTQLVAGGMILAVTLLGVGLILTKVTWAGCAPVASPVQLIPQVVIYGVLWGAVLTLPNRIGRRRVLDGRPWLGVFATSVSALVLAFGVGVPLLFMMFPPLTCAAPPA
jgi:hypothetical protein